MVAFFLLVPWRECILIVRVGVGWGVLYFTTLLLNTMMRGSPSHLRKNIQLYLASIKFSTTLDDTITVHLNISF
jgi:hypothetical protein